jgi:hypothetical protein
MGGWGSGSFENDCALDFIGHVRDQGVETLFESLVLFPGRGLVGYEAEEMIAASEIVAAAFGQAAVGLPPDALELARLNEAAIRARPDLPAMCLRALARATDDDSEMLQLFYKPEGLEAWIRSVHELERRLRAIR